MVEVPETPGETPGPDRGAADDPVERLVAACIDQMRRAGLESIEDILRAEPALAPDARRRLDALHRLGLLPQPGGSPQRFGRYEVIETLGRGGMGVVYRVRDDRLGRELALKALAPHVLPDTAARERFRLEARAMARLRHGNIVPVHDAGEVDGAPFFTMEHVAGVTLDKVLAALRSCGREPRAIGAKELRDAVALDGAVVPGATLVEFALRIAIDVAHALEHAHRHGVLHRDVKPGNVLVATDGRALLFDFGVAQMRDEPRVTRSGELLGTLENLAPELLAGAAAADARADVFGLGATFYEVLTLVAPFRGANAADTLARIESGAVTPIPRVNAAVSQDIDAVCRCALQRDPGRRYSSAADFAADLTRALRGEPVVARNDSAFTRIRRAWRTRVVRVAAVVGVTALLAGAIGFGLAGKKPTSAKDVLILTTARVAEFERIEQGSFQCRADGASRLAHDLLQIGDLEAVLARELAPDGHARGSPDEERRLHELLVRTRGLPRRRALLVARLVLRAAMAVPDDDEITQRWRKAVAAMESEGQDARTIAPQPDLVPLPQDASPASGSPNRHRFWLVPSGADPSLDSPNAGLVLERVRSGSGAFLAGIMTDAVRAHAGSQGVDPLEVLGLREPTDAERDAARAAGIAGDALVVRAWN